MGVVVVVVLVVGGVYAAMRKRFQKNPSLRVLVSFSL